MDNNKLISKYEKKIKILEKKLKRSEENRLHVQEMKDKTQLLLTKLKDEIDEANAIIKNRNIELKELKEEAENAAKIKSEFLANMSHEIRTPMNAIVGFTNLIYKTELTKKQEDYINKIGNAAHNLLHIINDILDFSKIDAGKLELENIKFSIEEVMNNLADMISIKAYNKGLEIIIKQDPKLPIELIGDPLRLGQVLLNLTDNAIKFTENGEIIINVSIKEKNNEDITLLFEVIDMGIGLDEKQINKLFQAFTQADTSTTRKYGGTGLGLIISKQITELMNGSIDVRSTLGEGSNFFFTANFKISKEAKSKNISDKLKNLSILIVANNEKSKEVLELYLKSFGINKVESVNESSLDTVLNKECNYDLIIIDSRFYVLEGIKLLRNLKNVISINNSKLILLTGYVKESQVQKAKQEDFDEVIIKPINQLILYDSIITIFEKEDKTKLVSSNKRVYNSRWDISGSNILIAEDNNINQQLIRELLEEEGVIVTLVNNGLAAYNILNEKRNKFDLVLMDLHMPILDGYKASRKIKNEIIDFKIPIIALTADAMSGTKEMVLNWDMDDYLTKPIVTEELFEKIYKWINNAEPSQLDMINDNTCIEREVYIDEINIEGLNTRIPLKRLRGNKELYLNILHRFLTYKNVCNEFEAINFNNITEKVRIAHTMKGLCGNIGAFELENNFKHIERLLIDNNFNNEEFLRIVNIAWNATNKICKGISSYLKDINYYLDKEEYNTHEYSIITLINLLKSYDSRVRKVFKELYPSIKNKYSTQDLKEISTSIDNYDFEEALLLIKDKIKKN